MVTTEIVSGNILLLTIDRPRRRNALAEDIVHALRRELKAADASGTLRAVVIAGASPGFCAGSDLKELAVMDLEQMGEHEAQTAAICREIAFMSKPVIAAVDGFALGGGLFFAICCDLVVSAANCRWHLPEVLNGWIPPWGLEMLVARTGSVAARRLTWGSEPCDGHEALRLGLADYLAADGQAVPTALDLARRLAALPEHAVATTKRYFAGHVGRNGETGDVLANAMFRADCGHPEALATLQRFGMRPQ